MMHGLLHNAATERRLAFTCWVWRRVLATQPILVQRYCWMTTTTTTSLNHQKSTKASQIQQPPRKQTRKKRRRKNRRGSRKPSSSTVGYPAATPAFASASFETEPPKKKRRHYTMANNKATGDNKPHPCKQKKAQNIAKENMTTSQQTDAIHPPYMTPSQTKQSPREEKKHKK